MNFPETLQKMMETKGVTKYRLAKDLGVSQSSVANWLNGSSPHPFMLDKIAAYFGCSAITGYIHRQLSHNQGDKWSMRFSLRGSL